MLVNIFHKSMCNFRNVDETLSFVIKCNKRTVRLNSCYFTFYYLTSFILYCHAEQLLYKFQLFHTIKHYNTKTYIEQNEKTSLGLKLFSKSGRTIKSI